MAKYIPFFHPLYFKRDSLMILPVTLLIFVTVFSCVSVRAIRKTPMPDTLVRKIHNTTAADSVSITHFVLSFALSHCKMVLLFCSCLCNQSLRSVSVWYAPSTDKSLHPLRIHVHGEISFLFLPV